MASRRKPEPIRTGGGAAARPRPRPQRRRGTTPWLPVGLTLGLIAVAVVVFLLLRALTAPSGTTSATLPLPSQAATDQYVQTLASLPSSKLDQVGQGAYQGGITAISGPSLKGSDGKPEVLYMGAEYCPYCAAERWAMIVALSRFGTFSGIKPMTSSATDVYANTPTFTFYGSTYTSQYIDFVPVEETTNKQVNGSYPILQQPTAEEQNLANTYDAPPYASTQGGIPFVYFDGRYMLSGATYAPSTIDGMSWKSITEAVQDPSTKQAQAILGSANMITAAICKVTGNQPASACTPTIQALESKL
jgi:thiol-disulfide isomerase/thioredoxin